MYDNTQVVIKKLYEKLKKTSLGYRDILMYIKGKTRPYEIARNKPCSLIA